MVLLMAGGGGTFTRAGADLAGFLPPAGAVSAAPHSPAQSGGAGAVGSSRSLGYMCEEFTSTALCGCGLCSASELAAKSLLTQTWGWGRELGGLTVIPSTWERNQWLSVGEALGEQSNKHPCPVYSPWQGRGSAALHQVDVFCIRKKVPVSP